MTSSNENEINITHRTADSLDGLPDWPLNIFYANACSIRKPGKFDKLKDILETIKHTVHIILLTENWFQTDEEAKTVNLDNYKQFYSFRNDKRGGGVSIYVRTYLEPELTAEEYAGNANYLWVQLKVNQTKTLDIGVIYNPSPCGVELNNFLEVFSSQLKERKRAVVFGDFNIDLLQSKITTLCYKATVKEANFAILNNISKDYYTRPKTNGGMIIDHACTNLTDCEFHLTVIKSKLLSDHYPLYLGIRFGKPAVNNEDVLQPNALQTSSQAEMSRPGTA